jgi:hypothetical protein
MLDSVGMLLCRDNKRAGRADLLSHSSKNCKENVIDELQEPHTKLICTQPNNQKKPRHVMQAIQN